MKKLWFGLLLLMIVGVTFWKLGEVPRSFHWDEAAVGYEAYSLLKTGADEYGKKWPVYFKSIGDYKYPGYSYVSMIPVLVLGLTTFSARFMSAFAGVVVLASVLLFAKKKKIFESEFWLMMGGVLLLFSPWYLMFARTARESMLGLMFIVLGCWAYYYKKYWLMAATFIASGLCYPAYRMFGLLLLFGLWITAKEKKNKSFILAGALVVGVLVGLTLDPQSRSRAEGSINFLDDATSRQAIALSYDIGMAMPGRAGLILARVMDNKVAVKLLDWTATYIKHFDLSYLFVSGNPLLPWYSVPRSGLLLLLTLPLFLLGLFEIGVSWKKDGYYKLLLLWILFGAIPAALTIETPNPIRQLCSLPAFFLIVLLGLGRVEKIVGKRKWLIGITAGLVLVSSVYGAEQFFIHREYGAPWYGNHGIDQIVEYVGEHQDEYANVVLPEDPYIFFLFFGHQKFGWSPSDLTVAERQWGSVTSLQNIVFMMPSACPMSGKEDVLYMCIGGKIPQNATVKFVTRFNDSKPSYALITFHKISTNPKTLPQLPEGLEYMSETGRPNTNGVIPEGNPSLWD